LKKGILRTLAAQGQIPGVLIDIIESLLEKKCETSKVITLDEVRKKILITAIDDIGAPEAHQIAAQQDSEFVKYVFNSAKSELEESGFEFKEVSSGSWRILKKKMNKGID